MKNVRVYFSKKEQSKYISHLDLMRCITRCIKKTDIPVWYTEGFNPHLYITFALPLSLGYEGNLESFDIKLVDGNFDVNKIISKLENVMPRGLEILDVSEDFMSANDIGFAQYDVTFAAKKENLDLSQHFDSFLDQESIVVEKKTKKKKMKQIDLKPDIKIQSMNFDQNKCNMTLILPAGNNGSINPGLIQEAFCIFSGIEMIPIKVCRTKIYTKDISVFK